MPGFNCWLLEPRLRGPSVLEGPGGPEASLLLRPHK